VGLLDEVFAAMRPNEERVENLHVSPRMIPASPTSIDQCKDDEWMNFNFPRSFENQGDCVSSVQTGN